MLLKPSVIINGNRTNVPIFMVLLKDGKVFKKMDIIEIKKVKIQVPLIMFKRDSVEKKKRFRK